MATRADGTGAIVPLAIYPPGFDLSGFLIYDPAVSDWVSGANYVRPDLPAMALAGATPLRGPGGPDGPDPSGPSGSGFYRVFHIPDWAFNVTNYTYDGPTFFPVDFADYMDLVDDVKLLVNGQVTDYAEFMPYDMGNGQTNWGMGIYFDRFASGSYTIQLVSSLRLSDIVGDGEVYLSLSNKVRTITINNQITFTNWTDAIQSDTYTFGAQIANPNSDWWIDIYDANGDYVNTGSGHTSNGHISWTWDLTDYLHHSRANFDSDPLFYSKTTFSTSGSGSTTTRSNPLTVDGYPNTGEWITSFQDRWFSDATGYPSDSQDKFTSAMGDIQGGPVLKGDAAYWMPLKFGTNVYSQADRDASWALLKSWLGSPWIRNWYYFGHGGGKAIGADRHTYDTNGLVVASARQPGSKAFVTSQEVKKIIGPNRYRFVFLDGCSTATGDWPATFGINGVESTLADYMNTNSNPKHLRPAVFVGWNQDIGGKEFPWTISEFFLFRGYCMGQWANDFTHPGIADAIDQANLGANYLALYDLHNQLNIYGYTAMKIEDYNHKPDWRW
jgi:hypothetical protein